MLPSTRLRLIVFVALVATVAASPASFAQAPRVFQGFAPRVAISVQRHAHSVVADDVNGDGHLDLIVAAAAGNSVAVFLGHGDGTFAAATYWPVGMTPKYAVTGDFNRDGHRDIVAADQDSNTISVLLGNGDGTFRPKSSYPGCIGDHEVAVADFNRDGNDDVVVACHAKPYFASVFLGNGDGTFRPRLDLHPGASPAAVVVGDFNRDGIADLAFANHGDDSVSVLLGNGDGTFKDFAVFATAKGPHGIRAGDLNGDGYVDLAIAADGGNSVTILFGKGDGGFGGRVDLPGISQPKYLESQENPQPKSVAVADVNADGHPDIVITNTTYPTCCTSAGSAVSVFLNRGDGSFGPHQDYYAGGNPFSLLVRDLNGDGKADLATTNFIDQTELQHLYLQALQELGVAPRLFKFVWLGFALVAGLLVAATGWRRSRRISIVAGLILTGALVGVFWKASRLRTYSDSHISILFGR